MPTKKIVIDMSVLVTNGVPKKINGSSNWLAEPGPVVNGTSGKRTIKQLKALQELGVEIFFSTEDSSSNQATMIISRLQQKGVPISAENIVNKTTMPTGDEVLFLGPEQIQLPHDLTNALTKVLRSQLKDQLEKYVIERKREGESSVGIAMINKLIAAEGLLQCLSGHQDIDLSHCLAELNDGRLKVFYEAYQAIFFIDIKRTRQLTKQFEDYRLQLITGTTFEGEVIALDPSLPTKFFRYLKNFFTEETFQQRVEEAVKKYQEGFRYHPKAGMQNLHGHAERKLLDQHGFVVFDALSESDIARLASPDFQDLRNFKTINSLAFVAGMMLTHCISLRYGNVIGLTTFNHAADTRFDRFLDNPIYRYDQKLNALGMKPGLPERVSIGVNPKSINLFMERYSQQKELEEYLQNLTFNQLRGVNRMHETTNNTNQSSFRSLVK